MAKVKKHQFIDEYLERKIFKYSYNKLHFMGYIMRNLNKPGFIKDVLNARQNPMNINIESYGEKNKDKIIYFCNNIAEKEAGFFAAYRWVLDALIFADRFGFVPVVNYGEEFCYAEKHQVNDTYNSFEYYFEQPLGISVNEALSSYNVVSYKPKDRKISLELYSANSRYKITDEYINNLGLIARKYIRLNQYVKPIIEQSISQIISTKKTLGVHVRGSDFKIGLKDHPVLVKPDEYIKYINEAIDKFQFEQVFLATDEIATIHLFEKEFGNKLVYYNDVTRTEGNISVAYSKSTRENHHYMLGLEVLRDMHTLANCSGLIAGISQVSMAARITKASQNGKYEFLKIFDKGIHRDGIGTRELYKQIIKGQLKKTNK